MVTLTIPEDLQKRYSLTEAGQDWLRRLPGIIGAACQRWGLYTLWTSGQEPWHGYSALAIPVMSQQFGPAVLKISYPHQDTVHEAEMLQLWNGNGAVKLFAYHAEDRAMLLERLDPDRSLQLAPMSSAISVWGDLVRELSISTPEHPQWQNIPTLYNQCLHWARELPQLYQELDQPIPSWMLRIAKRVCADYLNRPTPSVLVHSDLHGGNILALPETMEWDSADFLAIDPQGVLGEAEFAVDPFLRNRLRDYDAAQPELALEARLHSICTTAGLNRENARAWTVVREVANALWYAGKENHEKPFYRSLWMVNTLCGKPPLQDIPHPHDMEIS